jgi:hypothetical protein
MVNNKGNAMLHTKMNDLICRVTDSTEQAQRVAFLCNECLDCCGGCLEAAKELASTSADGGYDYSLCATVLNSL